MDRINLGRIEVIHRDTQSRVPASTVAILDNQFRIQPQTVSLEKALELTGFKIWQPTLVAARGLVLDRVQVVIPASQPHQVIATILKYKESTAHWIVLRQSFIPKEKEKKPKVIVPFELWEGTIQNRPVAFYTHNFETRDQLGSPVSILHCLWEHQDFLMELQGRGLSAEQMTQLGESLA